MENRVSDSSHESFAIPLCRCGGIEQRGFQGTILDRTAIAQTHVGKAELMAVIKNMDQPGYRLHLLKGKRKDYWSVCVSANR